MNYLNYYNYFIQIISWKRMKELYSSYEQVMKKSWTSHQQILNKLWTSHDLFMTCSLFVHDLFVTCSCSQLLHYLFILVHLSTTSSWLVHNLFINLFMTCLGLIHTTYEFMKSNKLNWLAGLSLAQLSPSLFQLFLE